MTHPYEKTLRAIIDRSHNGELGTSKVMDMRRIAEEALAGGPKIMGLEWSTPYTAKGLGIEYAISEYPLGSFAFHSPFYNKGPFTIDEAHEFAQAHFETQVNGLYGG